MSEEAFVARNSPWRIVLLFAASAGFVVAGLWIAGVFGESPKPGQEWLGWFSAAFFGATIPLLARRLFDTNEQLRISASGIQWKQWSGATIPWREICDIGIWEHKRQKMIVLHLVHAARFPSAGILGRVAGLNRKLTGGDIAISLTGTDRSFQQAMAAIERLRP